MTRVIENRRYPLDKLIAAFQRSTGVEVTDDDVESADAVSKSSAPGTSASGSAASSSVASVQGVLNVPSIAPLAFANLMDGPPPVLAMTLSHSVMPTGAMDTVPKSFALATAASSSVASVQDMLNVPPTASLVSGNLMGPSLALALTVSHSNLPAPFVPHVASGLAAPRQTLSLSFSGQASPIAGASTAAPFTLGVRMPQNSSVDAPVLPAASSSNSSAADSSVSNENPPWHRRSLSTPKSKSVLPTVPEASCSTSPESTASECASLPSAASLGTYAVEASGVPSSSSFFSFSSSSSLDTVDPKPPVSAPLPQSTMSDSALVVPAPPRLKLGHGSHSAPLPNVMLSFASNVLSAPVLGLSNSFTAPPQATKPSTEASRFVSTLHPSYNIYGVHGAPALRPMLMRSNSGPNPLALGGSSSYPVPQHPSVLPSINVGPRLHRAAAAQHQHAPTLACTDGGHETTALVPDPVIVPMLDSSQAALQSCTPVTASFFTCPATASTPDFMVYGPGASGASGALSVSVSIPDASDAVDDVSSRSELAAVAPTRLDADFQRRRLPSALDDVRNGNAGHIKSDSEMSNVADAEKQPNQNVSLVEALLEVLAFSLLLFFAYSILFYEWLLSLWLAPFILLPPHPSAPLTNAALGPIDGLFAERREQSICAQPL